MSEDAPTPAAPPAEAGWFLRIDDRSVFGPVALPKLREWAQQGRVAPGNELSTDRQRWVPAETLPELEMVWDVELDDGTYFGPLNIHALRDLVEDATITPASRMVNRVTGQATTVEARRGEMYAESAEQRAAQDLAQQHRENEETLLRVEVRLRESAQRLDELRRDLEREKEAHAAARGHAQKQAEALAAAAQELEGLRGLLDRERQRADGAARQGEQATRELAGEVTRWQEAFRWANAETESTRQQAADEKAAHARTQSAMAELRAAFDRERAAKEADREAAKLMHAEIEQRNRAIGTLTRQRDEVSGELRGERDAHAATRKAVDARGQELAAARVRAAELDQKLRSALAELEQSAAAARSREQELGRKLGQTEQAAADQARALARAQEQLTAAQAVAPAVKSLQAELEQERARIAELQSSRQEQDRELLRIKGSYEAELGRNRQRVEELLRRLDEASSTEVVVPELVRDSPPPPPPPPEPEPPKQARALADLEAQAQRELRAWQNARRGGRKG